MTKKIYQIAEDRKKLEAQKAQDVVKNQVQYIEELEEDLSEYISPANQALFKIFEQNAQRSLDIPLDLFPKVFREYGKELKFILNIPNNFIVGGILAALSGAIGNSVRIWTTDYPNTASLYIILVGGSGSGKTPAMEKLLKPLDEIEGKLTYEYKLQYSNWKKNKDTEGIHPGIKPVKESIKITGGNMEGILNRLINSPKGLVIESDELAGFFNSLNQYRKGNDLQNYLSIWSNRPIDTTRKSDEDGYLIHNPFITIIGGIQPGTFKKIIATIGSDDGFLWRFLPCINTVEKLPYYTGKSIDKNLEQNYINRVVDIYESLHRDTLVRNIKLDVLEVNQFGILLSAEANLSYNDYCNYCRKRENETPNDQIKEILGKIKIYCLRLALILHVAENGTDLKKHDEVDSKTLYRAIELSEYFFEAMQQNFDIVSGENKNIIGIDRKYLDLYNSLPDTEFKRVVAVDEAKKFNIGQRMCCNFLKNNDYFKRTSYGKYLKTLDS
jgi:hypothetical protein